MTKNAFVVLFLRFLRTLLGGVALFGFVFAQAASQPPTANMITAVEPTVLPGGKVVIKVSLKQPLAASPVGFAVSSPARIALDLPDTGNATGKTTQPANLGVLTSVNVVQAGSRTRLVLNLSKSVPYDTRLEGNALFISLADDSGAAGAAGAAGADPRFAEAAPGAARHAIRDIDFRRGANGEARIVTTLSDAQTGINIRQQAKGVVIDFIDTELPRALQRRLDVVDFATPVQFVESYPLGGSVRMMIEPKGGWEYAAYQTDNQFIVEVKPVTDSSKAAAGKPKYVGEKLSLNFQNVEVRSVLQVIADFTGLNIVTSDTVAGNLTLRLKEVPWDQALDLILQTKGLDKRASGNVIWIAPKEELLAKEKAEFEARAAVADLEPMVTEFIPLNYLRADEAQRMIYGEPSTSGLQSDGAAKVSCTVQSEGLTAAASQTAQQKVEERADRKILSKRGRVTYDLKTNTLILNDVPSKIQEIRDLLTRLDVPTRQVMIEARVVIADDKFGRQLGARLGTSLGGISKIGGSQTGIGLGANLSDSQQNANAGSGLGAALPNINLPATNTGASPATLGLTLLNIATGNLISLELQALEADNRGKVIASPRVVTSNQKPAVILQGVQIPNVTINASSTQITQTVVFKDAFLCLLVDPQILNNDAVVLTVEVSRDTPGETITTINGGFATPINTRRVKTQVQVNNGETAVLGGIFEQVNRNDINKVPFLGDVPFLGNLFKNSSKSEERVELLIFLTPRVLDDRLSLR
jgi:type IV pilus assembly protein PilQ